MRLVAILVIALMPAGALAQPATTGAGQGGSPSSSTYGGGSAFGSGSSGYDGGAIDSATPIEPRSKGQAPQSNMGGNYSYGDKSKATKPQ